MPKVFSNVLNRFIQQVFWFIQNKIVSWSVLQFRATEATLEFGDAVKAVLSFVFTYDSP